jgi:hypothetical protein
MIKTISHVDEKVLTPVDTSKAELTDAEVKKHYDKPVRGYVVISDKDGKVLETPNLVLLSGREFLAQKLADISGLSLMPPSDIDLTNFKIRYFGVGRGGADVSAQPNKIGPFDNDLDLADAGKFADNSLDTETSTNLNLRYQYLHNGRMKKIQSDEGGSIEIVKENHSILINGQDIDVEAYTTIKYTMIIRSDELYKEVGENELGPFAFNEAGLYAIEHEDVQGYSIPAVTDLGTETSRYSANYRCFARFTTLTKWLEVNDSLRIEWYILV